MSIARCEHCGDLVDTDEETDCYDYEACGCLCTPCREEMPELETWKGEHCEHHQNRKHPALA